MRHTTSIAPFPADTEFTVLSNDRQIDYEGDIVVLTIDALLHPQQSGKLILPVLQVNWFNTEKAQAEITKLPQRRFHITPTPKVSTEKVTSQKTNHPSNLSSTAELATSN